MASNKAVQPKREGTKDGGLAQMGCSFISGHVSNPCPRQWLVKASEEIARRDFCWKSKKPFDEPWAIPAPVSNMHG